MASICPLWPDLSMCWVLCFRPSAVCFSGQPSYFGAFGGECLGPPAFLVMRWPVLWYSHIYSFCDCSCEHFDTCVELSWHVYVFSPASSPSSLHSNVFLTFFQSAVLKLGCGTSVHMCVASSSSMIIGMWSVLASHSLGDVPHLMMWLMSEVEMNILSGLV